MTQLISRVLAKILWLSCLIFEVKLGVLETLGRGAWPVCDSLEVKFIVIVVCGFYFLIMVCECVLHK